MERITTNTRVVDGNGPGRDGFGDSPPEPSATQLDASWFNNIQEEVGRAIEDQGIVLDGTFDQLTTALNSWSWSDNPSIKSGATLSCLSGGTIEVQSGGVLDVLDGGSLTTQDTAIVNHKGDVTLGVNGTDILTCNSTANFTSPVNIAGNTITSTAGGGIDVETTLTTILEFDDSGSTLPASPRQSRFNTTARTTHMSDGIVRSDAIPDYGYEATFSTVNAIDDTGAFCEIRLQETESAIIMAWFDYDHSTGPIAGGTLSTRFKISGPATVDVNIRGYRFPVGVVNFFRPHAMFFQWTPTDTFVLPGTFSYTIRLRVGSSLGATMNCENLGISVVSAIKV